MVEKTGGIFVNKTCRSCGHGTVEDDDKPCMQCMIDYNYWCPEGYLGVWNEEEL